MKKLLMRLFLPLLMAIAATACQSDYDGEAVIEARKYALDNLKGLNEEQVHHIRYTTPTLYANLIFPRYVTGVSNVGHIKIMHPSRFPIAPEQDFMHLCFVWNPPGLDGSVVVIGEGERNLRFWYPYRVVVKNYVPAEANLVYAHKISSDYVKNEIGFVTNAELNRVRFSQPEVLYTSFDIAPPKQANDRKEDEALSPLEEYLESLEDGSHKVVLTQMTLFWPADKEGVLLAVVGYSPRGTLYEWLPQQAQYVSKQEAKEATLSADDIKKIKKDFGKHNGQLIFPDEPPIKRGNTRGESGSLFGGNMKF